MISEMIIASENQGKIKEIQYYAQELPIQIHTLTSLNIHLPEELEAFSDYHRNAQAKADYVYMRTGLSVLADDSGLEVDFLGGAPGVHSARYSSEGTSHANRRLLLENMKTVEDKDRSASFVCVLCWKNASDTLFFEGRSKGLILEKELGEKGFGYDPVFFDEEMKKTYAELSFEEKIGISHRGRALEKWLTYMKNLQ
jgi:XTP/dITP diphosphohydrolase